MIDLDSVRKRDDEMNRTGSRDSYGCADRHWLLLEVDRLSERIEKLERVLAAAQAVADAGALLASGYPHFIGNLRKALAHQKEEEKA